MNSSVVVVIGADQRLRTVLSIQERPVSKDLTVFIKQATHQGLDPENPDVADQHQIIEQHLSIHNTPNSNFQNAITFKQVLRDGTVKKVAQYSEAIKKYKKLAWIVAQRHPDLRGERYLYIPSKKHNVMNIGAYDSQQFHLITGLYVAPHDAIQSPDTSLIFSLLDELRLNFAPIAFSKFVLILIWNFMAAPPQPWGHYALPITAPPSVLNSLSDEALKARYQETAEGLTLEQAIVSFADIERTFRTQFINVCVRQRGATSPSATRKYWREMLEEYTWFFRHGDPATTGYFQHLVDAEKRFQDRIAAIAKVGE
jgi:hypothetical protein